MKMQGNPPEWARYASPVPLNLRDRAPAPIFGKRAREPARARVHRGDELEACRERHHATGTRDQDATLLERLTERLEDIPVEFRELVEEKDAVMGPRDLAGRKRRPAAHHGRI